VSSENYSPAYKTRLGNLAAKSVLVLLVDQANVDGLGWPSIDYIADRTEIKKRTVLRILQVFAAMGLIVRLPVVRFGKKIPGYQLDMTKLGMDLADAFSRSYAEAQKKKPDAAGKKCRRDIGESVSETRESVSETHESVSETLPPDPHIGRPVIDPVLTQTPPTPSLREGEKELSEEGEMTTSPARAEQAGIAQLIDAANKRVCDALGIVKRRHRQRMRAVIVLETEQGGWPPDIAEKMLRSERRQREARKRGELTGHYSVMNFFELGIWKDEGRWFWNEDVLRKQAEAGTGSR
jgi:hypothetical protein